MLESMTGYGRGEYSAESIRAVAELRSVNNRYCEVSIKVPSQLQPFEASFRDLIQKRVHRGKVTLTLYLEYASAEDIPVSIEENLLRKRIRILEKIKSEAGIQDPLKLEHLLVFNDLFEEARNDTALLEKKRHAAQKAVEAALDELIIMRLKEGENLQVDLEKRLNKLKEWCRVLASSEKDRIPEAKKRMSERINLLLEDQRIQEDRLEQEIAILADRLDISEELVRMESHISFFVECLEKKESHGKKINFILQEMHREANTIGSKAHQIEVSRTVVEIKEIIEIIREQIQNIA